MKAPLTYIIIEDNRIDELALLAITSTYKRLQHIASLRSITEAKPIIQQCSPAIIFIDIELPDGIGIDFIRSIKDLKPIVIFITSHSEFALEGFELSALDYILKPVTPERFALTYQYITEYHEMSTLAKMQIEHALPEVIVFKDGFDKVRLAVEEILYVQAMQDYTKIVTRQKMYLANNTLSVFLKENQQFNFIRIHRSYALLRRQIKIVQKDKIIGQGFELPIGKTFRVEIARLKL